MTRSGYQFTSENGYGPLESLLYLSAHRVIVLQSRRQCGNLLSSKRGRRQRAAAPGQWLSCRNTTVPNVNNVPMPALCEWQPGRCSSHLWKQHHRLCSPKVLMAAQLKVRCLFGLGFQSLSWCGHTPTFWSVLQVLSKAAGQQPDPTFV